MLERARSFIIVYDILILEDDEDIREYLVTLLEDEGYRVKACANGQEGLDWLFASDRNRPKLILLDYMMPLVDAAGFRARQLAHASVASIACVLISAHGSVFEVAERLSIRDVLPKPIRIERLLTLVRSATRA